MGTAKADHKAIDTDINLETDKGSLIKIDSDSWFQWLEENASFKFVAGFGGEDSYRARKEVLGGVVYWYAFKKVNGKLHKRYIGKPHEVTHNRLCEVAKSIRDVKVKPAKEDKINNDSNQIGNTNLQGIVNQLVNQVQELSNRLDNLENKGDDTNEKKPEYLPSEELEARIRELERLNKELTKELASEQVKVSSLSKNLQHREDNFPYSLEYIKQFGDFYINALRHKEKLPSDEVEQYKIGARKFINFIEVNQRVPGPAGGFSHGMAFNLTKGEDIVSLSSYLNELTSELSNKDSKLIELTNELANELANKDRELQELTNNIANLNSKLTELTNELSNKDRELQELKASVPSPQSPITNTQPVEAEGRSQEAGENLTAGGDGGECDRTYQNIPLEELHLTTSVYNILKRQQINSIGDLFNYSEDELLQAWNFGQKALNEVKEQLKRRLGLDFPQSTSGEDKPTIILHDGSILAISSKQETVLTLLGLIPQTHNLLTSKFLGEFCKSNLADNKGELESLIKQEIDSKDSTIRKTTAILRSAGFVLSGSEGKGFKITGIK